MYLTVGILIFRKFNKTVAKTAPYIATTCKGLFFCVISPLNQGLKKSSIQGLRFYYSRGYEVKDFTQA